MVVNVQKWGNSQGLRVSKQVLEDAHISIGDEVDLVIRDGSIVVTPITRVRGKHSLRTLVAKMPKGYSAGEHNWGGAVGKEVW